MEQLQPWRKALVVHRLAVIMVAMLRPAAVLELPVASTVKPACTKIPWSMLHLWPDWAQSIGVPFEAWSKWQEKFHSWEVT